MTESESLVADFRARIQAPLFDDIEDVKHILCPNKAYLATLTADECFGNCMTLMTYKMATKAIISELEVKKQLIDKYLNQIYAKYWFKAPEMLPKEIRRDWLNNDQAYLKPIVKKLNIIEAWLKDAEGRVEDINKTITFYENKGKAIQWSK